jgi:CNT family concentrative nucleoside transporter
MIEMLRGASGMAALVLIAFLLSENRRQIRWRTVSMALALQIILALMLLKLPVTRQAFALLNTLVHALEAATQAGTSFVFGYLGGGRPPFAVDADAAGLYILAFRGLPLILVASALSSVLFYWRVLPVVVRGFAWLLKRSIGVGGAEGLAAAANVFLGMVEAPVFVRPYLDVISRGELFSLMVCGMATIAGTVMVLYASILAPALPDALGHLMVASIISAPAAIATARIMVPATPEGGTDAEAAMGPRAQSTMEAVTNGTLQGLTLLLNVVAMLIVLVALVKLVNLTLEWLPDVGGSALTLQRILGWCMAPLVWLVGVPWSESAVAGSLMGTKTVLNEFLAYLQMAQLGTDALADRSKMILTYAMCGFANFGSLGIMIGGLGVMSAKRRPEVVQLGLKSIVAGTLATLMTGALVGALYPIG